MYLLWFENHLQTDPVLVDLDLDGDLDLAITSGDKGKLTFLENLGGGWFMRRDEGMNPLQSGNAWDGAGSYGVTKRSNVEVDYLHAQVIVDQPKDLMYSLFSFWK